MNVNKKAVQEKLNESLGALNSPCTITEAVQLARGVATDIVNERLAAQRNLQVATTLQLELLKEILIESGITSLEVLQEKYKKRVEEFNKASQEMYEKSVSEKSEANDTPKMSMDTNDFEVR